MQRAIFIFNLMTKFQPKTQESEIQICPYQENSNLLNHNLILLNH